MTSTSIRRWIPDRNCSCRSRRMKSGLMIRTYRFPVKDSNLAGKRIFFISDLHVQLRSALILPDAYRICGTGWLEQSFREAFETIGCPDWFVFGGDLCSELTQLKAALRLLDLVPENAIRLAVPGNWEQYRPWMTRTRWNELFGAIGYHYLCNEAFDSGGLTFYGLDEFKTGLPRWSSSVPENRELIILSHNPDSVPASLPCSVLERKPLILCGHTHGGQVRLPGYGALCTSSIFRKRFEYGCYRHNQTGTPMLIGGGTGVTRWPFRLFCPPELLEIRLEG